MSWIFKPWLPTLTALGKRKRAPSPEHEAAPSATPSPQFTPPSQTASPDGSVPFAGSPQLLGSELALGEEQEVERVPPRRRSRIGSGVQHCDRDACTSTDDDAVDMHNTHPTTTHNAPDSYTSIKAASNNEDEPQEEMPPLRPDIGPRPYTGNSYNATHNNHAPMTAIQHASHVTMVSQGASDDLLLLESLPRHPDISGEWTELVKGSRDAEMNEIWGWINTPVTKELIFWVHGGSGLGKTALACQLKDDLRSKNLLAASISLGHLPSPPWGPETIIRLIGAEIGRMHPRAVSAVVAGVRQCHGASLNFHVEKLVRDPLLALGLHYPLVIVIDGFSNCNMHSSLIRQLSCLSAHCSSIRVVVLGQPEPSQGLLTQISIRSYPLAPVSSEVMAECLETRFDTLEWKPGGRPTPQDVTSLASIAKGSFSEMEKVVSIFRGLPPSNYTDLSSGIYSLAWSARERFDKSGSMEDLQEAILTYRVCLVLYPSGHSYRVHTLNNLGKALNDRFLKSQSAEDLEEAIRLHREALGHRPPGHEDRHWSCSNLAAALLHRYLKDRSDGDLDEAILLGREAVSLRPQGHQFRFESVDNLRIYLEDRFKAKGAIEDIQEAIALAEEAVSTRPVGAPNYDILPGKLAYYKAELARLQASSTPAAASDSDRVSND